MGQPVAVVEKPTTIRGVMRFEANRSLTGMGHERFQTPADAVGPRPAAELARRLFATGQVDGVHVYSNVITVSLQRGCNGDGLGDVVRDLYQYWRPGMEPATFAEPAPDEGAAATADGGDAGGAGGASAYEQRVPQILRERSAAALAKWRAAHGG